MKNCYLHSAISISPQNTFESDSFFEDAIHFVEKKAKAIHPNYREFISPSASRRMAPVVKMGVAAAYKALTNASLEQPDAIITSTGMGCIADTEQFLNALISKNEKFLTPTSFIQSTHNTVGAQIALGLGCNVYNNTYTHGSLSFESALTDAQLMLEQDEASTVLVGGIDELGNEFVDYVQMMEEKDNGITVPFGEGASFFVLSSEKREASVQLLDVTTISTVSTEEISTKLIDFINHNTIEVESIDAVLLGNNGDMYDSVYRDLSTTLFANISQIHYKNFCGEYYTSSAFGFWLGTQLIQKKHIPIGLVKNKVGKREPKTVLLYNQFKGKNHSFKLLQKC